MSDPIRLLVVMPRNLMRCGIVHALQSCVDIGVVGSYEPCADIAKSAQILRPDVILVGVDEDDGHTGHPLATCQALRDAAPDARILVLADRATAALARDALAIGARGVFETSLPIELLRRAVRSVHAGELWLSRALVGALLEHTSPCDRIVDLRAANTSPLTAREHEVLVLLAAGHDHRRIGDDLFVSPHTARTHIRNVMRKLGAHSRLEAVLVATNLGIIGSDEPDDRSELAR